MMKTRNTRKGNSEVTNVISKSKDCEEKIKESEVTRITNDDNQDNELDCRKMIKEQKKKSGGGFQRMGLSKAVLNGILRKGYKVPTPIQRKTIPIIMEGRDVVAMARTGSGKTAAFLVPLFERLKVHRATSGARALILSPTRELALQTLKFIKELGRATGLRTAVIVGGDKIEDQFGALHENPDVIVATPGRFMHILIEMSLKLTDVEYVVFDEADRLFDLGFQEQLQEIVNRLPTHRQTLLFSATLPRLLADFAQAGLNNPELVRLDLESNLSNNLKTVYLLCRSDEKLAVLLHLLTNVIERDQMTVVFLATKHHVNYICELLTKAEVGFSYVYSTLDQTARKIEIAKFQSRKSSVLLVTDVAARGIDVPLLDNVINYNFPSKPKLFVHRVGRVARAGRSGTAYSIISPDETSYLLDLHMFLGHPMLIARSNTTETDGVVGIVPQQIVDEEVDLILTWHESSVELRNLEKVCRNAYEQYVRSRPLPSKESAQRIKSVLSLPPVLHPLFQGKSNVHLDEKRNHILQAMKTYRPNLTAFEFGATAKSQANKIMKTKKHRHNKVIEERRHTLEEVRIGNIVCKNQLRGSPKEESLPYRDEEHYLFHRPSDHHVEKGLGLDKAFKRQIAGEVMDLTGDDSYQIRQSQNLAKWDRKRKKFTHDSKVDSKRKKIKTESGVWIPASYKSHAYKHWKERTKVEQKQDSESDVEHTQNRTFRKEFSGNKRRQQKELKTKEEILKMRKKRERIRFHQKRRQTINAGRKRR